MNLISLRLTIPCLLLVTTLLGSHSVHAKDYLVELVIFETKAGRKLQSGALYFPNIGESLQLGTDTAASAGFIPIEENLSLSEHASSIAASSRYRVLRHMAWRQPGLDDNAAVAVRINLGDPVTVYLPEKPQSDDTFTAASLSPTLEQSEATPSYVINGTIKVRLGRFLHMDALLAFTDPQTGQGFRLTQSRKMRSQELHYIDNPRFGILTRILPLDDVLLPENEEGEAEVTPE